jgi:chemotaxis-related protein WspB
MHLLTFTIGAEVYAVASRLVVEVLPLVPARPIPHMPPFVRGIFSYRGRIVPLVDLGLLLLGRPLRERLSTRVIVIDLPAESGGDRPPLPRLGMVAENVVSFCRADAATPSFPAWHMPDAPYLGRVLRIEGRTVQLIDTEHLLPSTLAAALAEPSFGGMPAGPPAPSPRAS